MMSRILIVDDEPACRDSMRLLLSTEGFAVEAAATPEQALTIAAETPPDLLLVDWMLKAGCDGLEVARRIRETVPGLRVVLTTGYPLDKVRAAAGPDETIEYLLKPFSPEMLIETVHRSLNRTDEYAGL